MFGAQTREKITGIRECFAGKTNQILKRTPFQELKIFVRLKSIEKFKSFQCCKNLEQSELIYQRKKKFFRNANKWKCLIKKLSCGTKIWKFSTEASANIKPAGKNSGAIWVRATFPRWHHIEMKYKRIKFLEHEIYVTVTISGKQANFWKTNIFFPFGKFTDGK